MNKLLYIALISILVLSSCKKSKKDDEDDKNHTPTAPPNIENTYGYKLLNKVKGIWNGPVTSTTALGSYPEWIVDFRPISENQISAKNELDTMNDIHMSFFIALYNNEYRLAFRNGGTFTGMQRVSYFIADSISENTSKSYYRFVEIKKGKSRAYTEVWFSNDSLYISSYTNKKNTLATSTSHMGWKAKLQDTTSCQQAVSNFTFPKKTMTKDFSNTFNSFSEAVFYSASGEPVGDPYTASAQPYLGQSNISYTYAGGYTPASSNKVILIITTQPLFSGVVFNAGNMKYRSRYVILSATDLDYTFNNMHPGSYYLYAIYDADGSKSATSGDWISTTNTTFALGNDAAVAASTQINFTIP